MDSTGYYPRLLLPWQVPPRGLPYAYGMKIMGCLILQDAAGGALARLELHKAHDYNVFCWRLCWRPGSTIEQTYNSPGGHAAAAMAERELLQRLADVMHPPSRQLSFLGNAF